jgi:arylsulfatase A-like enzyme
MDADDRLTSDGLGAGSHLPGMLALATAAVLAWVSAGLLEWFVYGGRGGLLGAASVSGLSLVPVLVTLVVGVPVLWVLKSLEPGLRRWMDGMDRTTWWNTFLTLFFLAFTPFPVFRVLVKLSSTISDDALQVMFTSSASVLGVGAALVAAVVAGRLAVALLGRLGLMDIAPGFALFWVFAFPGSWLVVPFAVVMREPELLHPAARLLFPLLSLVLMPLVALAVQKLPRALRLAAAFVCLAVVGGLFTATLLGPAYSSTALTAPPFTSLVYSKLKKAVDLDGDGQTRLFDGGDCDESNDQVHRMAFDRPENGVDEDCDGSDASSHAGLLLGDPRPFVPEVARKYNVLVVLLDAVRADHVHAFGYKRKTTPNIDRLAEQSLVFTQAVSQYPSTGISVPSMLSGRYPEYMVWGKPKKNNQYVLLPENELVTDVLRRNGYSTHALVAAWIDTHILGFKDHFDRHEPLYPHSEWKKWVRDSSRLAATRAIEFFEHRRTDKPFFLLLHFEEPHEPYVDRGPPGKSFGKKDVDRYDSDIFWTDLWLGFVLGYLEMKGLTDDTVIIVLSDHGEEFGEHGKKFHGHQIYQESIHVPLMVRIPGGEPALVESRVGLVDLFPTILDITGIEHDRSRLQGVSLLRTAAGATEADDRPVFSMLADREKEPTQRAKAVLRDNWKYVHDLTRNRKELYDLHLDPREKSNMAGQKLPVMDELAALLRAFLDASHPSWQHY